MTAQVVAGWRTLTGDVFPEQSSFMTQPEPINLDRANYASPELAELIDRLTAGEDPSWPDSLELKHVDIVESVPGWPT